MGRKTQIKSNKRDISKDAELKAINTRFFSTGPTSSNRSKAIVLLWFSVACFGVRVSLTFHKYVCLYYF